MHCMMVATMVVQRALLRCSGSICMCSDSICMSCSTLRVQCSGIRRCDYSLLLQAYLLNSHAWQQMTCRRVSCHCMPATPSVPGAQNDEVGVTFNSSVCCRRGFWQLWCCWGSHHGTQLIGLSESVLVTVSCHVMLQKQHTASKTVQHVVTYLALCFMCSVQCASSAS